MTTYEKQRMKRIEGNKARMKAMGLTTMATSLLGSVQNVKKQSGKSRTESERIGKRKIDDDYRPAEDDKLQGLSSSAEEGNVDYSDEEVTIPQKNKTRGKNRCKQIWQLDGDKRIKIECNDDGQPIRNGSVDLAASLGLFARMGNYCYIAKKDWRHIIKDDYTKEKLISYLKARYIFPDDKKEYEKCIHSVLGTIGANLSNHKYRLRQKVNKYVEEEKSIEQIHALVPKEVEDNQLIDFVNDCLTKEAKEIEQGGPVNHIDSYQETHKSKNDQINPTSTKNLDQCESLKKQKISPRVDVIDLKNKVIREVWGPEHSGHVRGAGQGPTPLSFFGSRRRGMSNDLGSLSAEVENLKKHEVERDAQLFAERAKMEAQLVYERAKHDKMEAQLVVKRAKHDKIQIQLVAERAKHDKMEAHLNSLQEKFDLYMSR